MFYNLVREFRENFSPRASLFLFFSLSLISYDYVWNSNTLFTSCLVLSIQVIYKTLAPQWNQIFEFQETGESLILHVKDHNEVLPTASIGHCTVEYSMLSPNQPADKWIPLQGVKSGEIHVKITRRAPGMEKKTILETDESAHVKGHKISTQV
jgi:Ca2+-dependent lipid-binding protein